MSTEGPRRLQRMGAVTVGISLPRAWVGERGLSAGSEVHVHALPDGSLLLRHPNGPAPPGRAWVVVGASTPPEHLFRELIGAYLGGAEEFAVHEPGGVSPTSREVVREFARRTVQPEIVSDSGTTLLLRDVSLGARLPIAPLVRRMFEQVLDLQRDAGRSWTDGPGARVEPSGARDDAVDRQAWLIERILSLRGATTGAGPAGSVRPDDLLGTFVVVRALERIADHATSLAEHGARLRDAGIPSRVASALSSFHAQALEHLASAFSVAERPDVVLANEVIDSGEALHSTQATLRDAFLEHGSVGRLPPLAVAALGLILQSVDRTVAYAQDIGEVGLDRAARTRIGLIPAVAPRISVAPILHGPPSPSGARRWTPSRAAPRAAPVGEGGGPKD